MSSNGIADDLSAADGLRVLDYWQVAMEAATCPGRTRHERPMSVRVRL
jgi:hypothetical protein